LTFDISCICNVIVFGLFISEKNIFNEIEKEPTTSWGRFHDQNHHGFLPGHAEIGPMELPALYEWKKHTQSQEFIGCLFVEHYTNLHYYVFYVYYDLC
jgi:hypothetical protein